MTRATLAALCWTLLAACAEAGAPSAMGADSGGGVDAPDAAAWDAVDGDSAGSAGYFATKVVAFSPGPGAGFGQDAMPSIVLGPPKGGGAASGSLDVVSLGSGGSIVLGFDVAIVDGPGPDFIVFENAFKNWPEPAIVGVSLDGVSFVEFPCDPTAKAAGFPGCAGVSPVHSAPGNGVDPADPAAAGGDAFDLKAIGLNRAIFVRVRDPGAQPAVPPTAGADLDAVVIVNAGSH